MRKLASIQKITNLEPIDGADMIEKATVLGWELVVAKKDNFKIGDLCVYCEIDSILPEKPEFEFLRERKFRIKTIKLRGQVSQGIAFPLTILSNKAVKEGDDVTDILGIKKYDPQEEAERKEAERLANIKKNRLSKFFMRYPWYRRLVFKPKRLPFPAWIKKTDEDRIQLFPDICEKEKGTIFQVTEKLDGQSATYFVLKHKTVLGYKYIWGVCSRNLQLLKSDGQSYWEIAKRLEFKKRMIAICKKHNYNSLVLQGEIIGPKIQGNKYDRKQNEFYVFNLFLNDKQIENPSLRAFCVINKFSFVPFLSDTHKIFPNINMMVRHSQSESLLHKIPREGTVWRNYDNGISFKVINPDFLLKYSE